MPTLKSRRKSVRKSRRKSVRKSRRKSVRKSRRKSVRKSRNRSARKSRNRSARRKSRSPVRFGVKSKKCPDGKVLNPASGRCVDANGKLGKSIANKSSKKSSVKSSKKSSKKSKKCPDGKIENPATGRCVDANGKLGKSIAAGGVAPKASKTSAKSSKSSKKCPDGKIENPASGRCVDANGKLGKAIAAGEKSSKKSSKKSSNKSSNKSSKKSSKKEQKTVKIGNSSYNIARTTQLISNGLPNNEIPLIGYLTNLIELTLQYNNMRNVSTNFLLNLTKLTTLNLNNDSLLNFPLEISSLTNLKTLSLNTNQLQTLPDTIGNLVNLEYLNLSNNKLTTLPDTIGNLVNLKHLNLAVNDLTTLPDTIGNLTNLETLKISANKIKHLPDSIIRLVKLKTLHAENNELENIPDNIGNLQNLETLFLFRNKLTYLPDSIGRLINLKSIAVSHNKILIIPDTVANLVNLQTIYFNNNELVGLPRLPNLLRVREFHAAPNPFEGDPDLIGKTDEEMFEIVFGIPRGGILDRFFGTGETPAGNDAPYKIYMSREFVRQTQYKPLPEDNDDLRIVLTQGVARPGVPGRPKPHVVYACPVGHLHSADECGVPMQISRCGFDGCKLFVGGLHHMLVPGSYIVYHDGYEFAKVWFGNFPVQSYRIYRRLVNQANTARRQMNPPERDIILQPQTPQEVQNELRIVARPLHPDDNILDMYKQKKAVKCNICGDELNLTEDNLYILPDCGHLLHRDDIEGYREGNLNNIYEYQDGGEDIADAEMAKRKCPVKDCGKRFAFGKK